MLYGVNPTDISILTHKFSPTSEKNGFKQTGRVVSLKYGTLTSDVEPDQNLGSWFSKMFFGGSHSGSGKGHVSIMPVAIPKTAPVSTQPVPLTPISPTDVAHSLPILPTPGNKGVVRASNVSAGVYPYVDTKTLTNPGNKIVGAPTIVPNLGDPYMGDPFDNLGFSLHSVTHAVSNAVKSVVSHPAQVLTKVATKAATGGITLVTDTGVLGKDAKKLGQRADVVAAGAIGGGAAGLVTGGVPGLFAGAVAGGTKGLVDATSTGNPSSINSFRTLYQGAAYGAAAGGVARAVNAGISSYQQAQIADSAAKAQEYGYGAAADTAHAASDTAAASQGYGAAADVAHGASDVTAATQDYGAASNTAQAATATTKAAASGLLSSSIKGAAELAGLKLLLGGGGNPLVLPGGDGAGSQVPVYIPGSGSDGGAFSSFPAGMTNTSLPANDGGLTPLPNPALTPASTILGMPPMVIYGLGAVAAFILIQKRRSSARAA